MVGVRVVVVRMVVLLRLMVLLVMMKRLVAGFWAINSPLTMQCKSLKILMRLFQSLPSTLNALIHKKRKTLRLTSLLINPKWAILNFPKLLKILKELIRLNIRRHIADKDLPLSVLRDRRSERRRGRDGPSGSQLAGSGAIADLLLGLLESLPGAAPVLEENKGVAFGLAGDAVGDRLAILDLAVLAEDGGEGFGGGVPAEAVDEDLAVGGVRIGELAHDFDQVRVLAHSLLDQSHEMVLRERL